MPDRIADAVAAKERYGAPVVVVDFGTATNIEVTDRDGNFVGGVIAPGVETSAAALFSHATRLAAIELADPHQAIGTQHGNRHPGRHRLWGGRPRGTGSCGASSLQLGYEAPVVATGGLATCVAELSATITHVDPELTLEGLRLIAAAQD